MKGFQPVHPLYERLRKLRGAVLIVEGIIGSGKSSLGKRLTELLTEVGLPCKFFEEEIDMPFLSLFLSDMKKYAFAFQVAMLKNRQSVYKQAVDFARNSNGVAIVDRSLHGDYAFALMHHDRGNISDEEWLAYEDILEKTKLPGPSVIIYLDVYPTVAMERITKRDRLGEKSTYTLEYLSDLDANYKVAMEESPISISYLDWNEPRSLTQEELLDVLDDVDP